MYIFNKVIAAVLCNHVPHETMITKISVGSDHLSNKEFKTKLLTTNDEKNSNDSKNCKAYWYWSLLTQLLKYRKIPLISPLCHENKFATDFKKKAEPFNCHFAIKHSLISSSIKLPQHIQYSVYNRVVMTGSPSGTKILAK